MDIQDFDVTVGKVVPEFDREFTGHVDINTSSRNIAFNKIRKLGR